MRDQDDDSDRVAFYAKCNEWWNAAELARRGKANIESLYFKMTEEEKEEYRRERFKKSIKGIFLFPVGVKHIAYNV